MRSMTSCAMRAGCRSTTRPRSSSIAIFSIGKRNHKARRAMHLTPRGALAGVLLAGFLAPLAATEGPVATGAPQRAIVVTVDDLPAVPGTLDIESQEALTHKLLTAIRRSGARAIGFVNEEKLTVDGKPEARRLALLEAWLAAGFELGNHTFDHPSLHLVGAAAFEASVLRGEQILRPLLARKGLPLR